MRGQKDTISNVVNQMVINTVKKHAVAQAVEYCTGESRSAEGTVMGLPQGACRSHLEYLCLGVHSSSKSVIQQVPIFSVPTSHFNVLMPCALGPLCPVFVKRLPVAPHPSHRLLLFFPFFSLPNLVERIVRIICSYSLPFICFP